jgi:hypothetical protein
MVTVAMMMKSNLCAQGASLFRNAAAASPKNRHFL